MYEPLDVKFRWHMRSQVEIDMGAFIIFNHGGRNLPKWGIWLEQPPWPIELKGIFQPLTAFNPFSLYTSNDQQMLCLIPEKSWAQSFQPINMW